MRVSFIQGSEITVFTGNMIRTDVGLFLKDAETKVTPYGLMITLCLVDGKQAVPEPLGTHIFLNPDLS
jgi:hypothetical protein